MRLFLFAIPSCIIWSDSGNISVAKASFTLGAVKMEVVHVQLRLINCWLWRIIYLCMALFVSFHSKAFDGPASASQEISCELNALNPRKYSHHQSLSYLILR